MPSAIWLHYLSEKVDDFRRHFMTMIQKKDQHAGSKCYIQLPLFTATSLFQYFFFYVRIFSNTVVTFLRFRRKLFLLKHLKATIIFFFKLYWLLLCFFMFFLHYLSFIDASMHLLLCHLIKKGRKVKFSP